MPELLILLRIRNRNSIGESMSSVLKVRPLQDSIYQVVELYLSDDERYEYEDETVLYQGALSDCEAYIRLKDSDYFI